MSAQARLAVTGGPLDGREVILREQEVKRFGTGPDCDLQVQAGHIEPLHATIRFEEGHLLLEDAGSVAGTYVNGEKVGAQRELFDGDRVCLGPPGFRGSVKMIVVLAAEAAAGADVALLDPADFAPPPTEAADPFAAAAAGEHDELPFGVVAPGAGDDFKLEDAETTASADEPMVFADSEPVAEPDLVVAPEAEAEPEPEPEPAPAPAPVAAAPAPAPAKPRTPAPRPEYTEGISMFSEGRERGEVPPPVAAPAPAPKAAANRRAAITPKAAPNLKRILIINGAIAVAALVALGLWRTFTRPTAVLSTLSSPRVRAGDRLTIEGTHLGEEPAAWTVRFGDQTASAESVTETSLTTVVPAVFSRPGPGQVELSVEGPGGRSNALVLVIARGPGIDRLDPDVALPGATVTALGKNLAGEGLAVTVGGKPAVVQGSASERLVLTVPDLGVAEGTRVDVVVRAGGETSPAAKLVVGRLPLVMDLAPKAGGAGTRVTLKGRGFATDAQANVVRIDGTPALVLTARADELTVAVPALGRSGVAEVDVTVETAGATSLRQSFRYDAPSTNIFIPRFVAAPVTEHVGHPHAYVSTAVGPILLLTGPDGARSVGQRAADAAEALNKLVDAAASGLPEIQAAPAPAAPAVLVGGQPLVTVTDADAAAFAEAWTGIKPSSPGRPALASYWAALVADHLALFAANQRPLRLLDLTPRGQVLLDLWSDAARRGMGGVPIRLVTPVPDDLASALRELALSTPAGGRSSSAALALAGTWNGTMVEGGIPRSIRVRLSVGARGLQGALSTTSGAVVMDLPLQEVAYEKGELRFKVLTGNAPRTFRGRLDGRRMTGTIAGPKGSGEFALELLQ